MFIIAETLDLLLSDNEKTKILSLDQKLDIGLQFYEAAAQMVELNLYHNDIKLENMMAK